MVNSKTLIFYAGSGVSQVVTLLTTLYIINHVSPLAFGNFSYLVAVGSIIGSLATLKYELSISISKNISEAYRKVNLTIAVSFILNFIIVGGYSLIFFRLKGDAFSLILLLANTISFNASLQQLLLYEEDHRYSGLFPLLISILNYMFLVTVFRTESGLLLSNVLANSLTTLVFLLLMAKKGFYLKFYSWHEYKQIFYQNISYPRYILPGAVSTILLTYFHPILVGFVYSKNEVGLFSFSLRILLLPTILVGAVLSGLLRAKLSKLVHDGDMSAVRSYTGVVIKWLVISSVALFPAIIAGIFCLKYFIDMNKWKGVEFVSIALALYAVSQFFYQPLSNIALVFNEGKLLLKLNLLQMILTSAIYMAAFIFHLSFHSFLGVLSAALFVFTLLAGRKFLAIIKVTVD